MSQIARGYVFWRIFYAEAVEFGVLVLNMQGFNRLCDYL